MSLVIPSNPHNLFEVSRDQLFYATVRHDLTVENLLTPGRKVCMILWSRVSADRGTLALLVVDEDGTMSIRHPPLSKPAQYWTFERYLTVDETLSIRGVSPSLNHFPDSVEDAPEIVLPTHDEVRESKDLGLIPDGLFYRVSQPPGGTIWQCVNCPPGVGKLSEINIASAKTKRTISLATSKAGSVSWSNLDLLTHDGWTFEGYVMPEDVWPNLKQYVKSEKEPSP